MRKSFTLFLIFFAVVACDKKSKIEKAVEKMPITVQVHRFEKDFFEAKPEELAQVKQKYPFFFPAGQEQEAMSKHQDPIWREVYAEVQKKYADFSKETQGIEDLFKHVKYYYPTTKIPPVYTMVNEMDYHTKVLYAKDTLIIALELYLGKDHKFYQGSFEKYIRNNFESNQILPDIATSIAETKVRAPENNTLLAQMIYYGKELYLKSLFLPEASDADLIGYTPEQIQWSKENEGYIWRYFIDEQLLYDSNPRLAGRFINPAPFSKFQLEVDNESPGRIGQWVGWQIVKSYVDSHEKTPLNELLDMDSKTLFEASRYKPKKTQ